MFFVNLNKYSVVALPEALEQELAGTGIGVSVLCPGPVNTPIATNSSQASEQLKASIAAGAAPELVANLTLDAILAGEFYIFSPTRMRPRVEQRFARILDALERAPT